MKFLKTLLLLAVVCGSALLQAAITIKTEDYGIAADKAFTAADVTRMLDDVRKAVEEERKSGKARPDVRLRFQHGNYVIGAEQCQERAWYISNHDQVPKRKVFLPLEGLEGVEVDFQSSTFTFRGRILFVGIFNSKDVKLRCGTFDYEIPMITQVEFVEVDAKAKTVRFRPIVGTQTEMAGSRLFFKGYDFRNSPGYGILFEADGRIAYRTSDCPFNLGKVTDNKDGTFTAANCAHAAFKPGQNMALRTWDRPAPGIVLSDSENVDLYDLTIHYADGMGVLAQNTKDVRLTDMKVVPNADKKRAFTTQADATHFSACSGTITSSGGTYVGMMDDAINVHGTYLKLTKRLDKKTVEGAYMHHQTYGITWGAPGEKVTFIKTRTMDNLEGTYTIDKVEVLDPKNLRVTFKEDLPEELMPRMVSFGMENQTRTPHVTFTKNRVANNRARGALFSTPDPVECSWNVFDHVSGCAIVLCGDCNGWYETGACKKVTIANNFFINNLTSPFQFTEAVISIYPVIPEIDKQTQYFHSNITIEDNIFASFTRELVYAKSVDGMTIRNNTFVRTTDYAPYRGEREWLRVEKSQNVQSEIPYGLDK